MTKALGVRGRKRFSLAFWIESFAGSFTGFLAILTLVWRDWIEGVFGYDPDHHNGSFEGSWSFPEHRPARFVRADCPARAQRLAHDAHRALLAGAES